MEGVTDGCILGREDFTVNFRDRLFGMVLEIGNNRIMERNDRTPC